MDRSRRRRRRTVCFGRRRFRGALWRFAHEACAGQGRASHAVSAASVPCARRESASRASHETPRGALAYSLAGLGPRKPQSARGTRRLRLRLRGGLTAVQVNQDDQQVILRVGPVLRPEIGEEASRGLLQCAFHRGPRRLTRSDHRSGRVVVRACLGRREAHETADEVDAVGQRDPKALSGVVGLPCLQRKSQAESRQRCRHENCICPMRTPTRGRTGGANEPAPAHRDG